jgi:hypothetical protein
MSTWKLTDVNNMETKVVKLLKWTRIAKGEDITVTEVRWNLLQASKFLATQ